MDDACRACRTLGQHRSTRRKAPQGRQDEARLMDDNTERARKQDRHGDRQVTALPNPAGRCVSD